MKCVLAYRNNKTLRLWFYLFCFFGTIDVLILNEVIDLNILGIEQDIYIPAALGLLALTLFGFLRRAFIPSVRMEYDTRGVYIYTITKKTNFVFFKDIKSVTCGFFPDGQVTIEQRNGTKKVVTCVGKRKKVLEDFNDALNNYKIAEEKRRKKEEDIKKSAEAMSEVELQKSFTWVNGDERHGIK